MAKKPVIVLMYDFDNTLSPSDMQTYTFMPMVGTNPAEFWSKADELCKSEKMDPNLAYMYLMLEKAKEKGKSDVKLSKKVIAIALASIMVITHPGNDLHIFGIRTEINDRIIDIGPYNQD